MLDLKCTKNEGWGYILSWGWFPLPETNYFYKGGLIYFKVSELKSLFKRSLQRKIKREIMMKTPIIPVQYTMR